MTKEEIFDKYISSSEWENEIEASDGKTFWKLAREQFFSDLTAWFKTEAIKMVGENRKYYDESDGDEAICRANSISYAYNLRGKEILDRINGKKG